MSQDKPKTHWKKLVNPAYLGAYSLEPGKDLTVTIDKVLREMVTSTGGKKEECTVAYLKGEKPLILNVTNCKTIAQLYGAFIEDWAGKKITIYATTTRLAGETVECLRIRQKVAEIKKEKLSNERFTTGLESISAGNFTAEQMREKFDLTEDQEKCLSDHVNLLVNGE